MTEKRDKQFNIRITETLYEEIKQQAEGLNMSMSEYAIQVLSESLADPSVKDSESDLNATNDEKSARKENKKTESGSIEAYLATLDNQLTVKDSQIKELTRLIDQQQQLSLTDRQYLTNSQKTESNDSENNFEETNSSTWWKFWK